VHNQTFKIVLWKNLDVVNNTITEVHRTAGMKPANIDSIDGFVNYYFDAPQIVSGTIYIGIIQDYTDPIGIGVDHNTNSNGKIFYNSFNVWYTSQVQGSLMMRPVLGRDVRVNVREV